MMIMMMMYGDDDDDVDDFDDDDDDDDDDDVAQTVPDNQTLYKYQSGVRLSQHVISSQAALIAFSPSRIFFLIFVLVKLIFRNSKIFCIIRLLLKYFLHNEHFKGGGV